MAEKMLPQLRRELARFGLAGDARDWVLRALHPAGQEIPCPGIPDESAVAVMRPQYRTEFTITAPASTGSWDCIIYTVPGDVGAVYWATAPATTGPVNFGQLTPPAGAQSGIIALQQVTTYPSPSIVTPFTAASSVTQCQSTMSAATPQAFRHMYLSTTVELIAASVADQGEVYCAQFPNSPCIFSALAPAGLWQASPLFTKTAVPVYVNVPTNETDISLLAPGYYSGPARDGVYTPIRHAGPGHAPFIYPERSPALFVDPQNVAVNGWIQFPPNYFPKQLQITNNVNGAESVASWVTGALALAGGGTFGLPFYGTDLGFSNMNIGVTIFRGLSAGASGFNASLKVKVMAGLEIQPMTDTPDRVYAKMPIPYDPKAFEAYYTIVSKLADAYPAKYNSLGEILGTIARAAKIALPLVAPTWGPMAVTALDYFFPDRPRGNNGQAPDMPKPLVVRPQPRPADVSYSSVTPTPSRSVVAAPVRFVESVSALPYSQKKKKRNPQTRVQVFTTRSKRGG